jgi:hypothetical protein
MKKATAMSGYNAFFTLRETDTSVYDASHDCEKNWGDRHLLHTTRFGRQKILDVLGPLIIVLSVYGTTLRVKMYAGKVNVLPAPKLIAFSLMTIAPLISMLPMFLIYAFRLKLHSRRL